MRYEKLLALLMFLAAAVWASPQPLAANKTWSGNFPKTGSVTIPAGDVVTLDTNVALTDLTVNGQLICADKNLTVSSGWIMVHGLLQCGTAAAPYTKRLDLTLTGSNTSLDVMGMGAKFLGAMGGGRIVLAGENRLGWTRLAATANKGSLVINLKVAPAWRVGDRIVVTSTDFHYEHAEERTISAIAGTAVTLDKQLQKQHWCATEMFNGIPLEECAEVGLLTRNIRIQGDAYSTTSGFGGHIMIMAGAKAKISGVELYHMGQKGRVARYPMHWHMVGDGTGQYMNNSSVVHSYNRFITIHGTHNVRLAGNVAFDTIGHGYYMEDGIEHGNVIEDNLGLSVDNAPNGLPTPSDKKTSVFWISNPDNTVRRNVAAGSEHTGFWLGFPEHPVGLSTTATIWPKRTPLREFDSNVTHSNQIRGLYVDGGENANRETIVTWFEPHANPADAGSPKVPPVFKNFTAYKNRYEGIWMRGRSFPVLQGAKLADNWMGAYFASLSGLQPATIKDSLVVGETANKGNPDSWEDKGLDGRELPHWWPGAAGDSIRGIEYYDGPMQVSRTLFANFQSNSLRKSGAITNLSPNPFWISSASSSSEISFKNANRVWLDPLTPGHEGDSFSVIRDIDGSITGVPNRRIVPKNPTMYTPICTVKSAWNAYICPYNYVGAYVKSHGVNIAGTELIRDDGAKRALGAMDGSPDNLHFVAIEDRPHTLNLPGAVPDRLTFVRFEQAGKAVRTLAVLSDVRVHR